MENLQIKKLGEGEFSSPLADRATHFIDDNSRILVCSRTDEIEPILAKGATIPSFEAAGPRETLFFNPEKTTCGLVTCGGLCPGLNNVIRSVVYTLDRGYQIKRILGFKYGFAGIISKDNPLHLTQEMVEDIHLQGGSLLGSSRGPHDPGEMAESLHRRGVNILLTIGGDGTLRGASAIAAACAERDFPISVIGIPKTIDNDLSWIQRSFGFATAVEEARKVIASAHAEARGAKDGIGLVKLMGRHSGFIAAHATLANSDVNICLVPEVAFDMEGERGFLSALERRLNRKGHAVVVVAEGAGQDFIPASGATDDSGNQKLRDVGVFLKQEIMSYFHKKGREVTLKYIDPSYIIRSLPANSLDSEFCASLGQHAVHAGMTGRTDMLVGSWNNHFIHLPISLAVGQRRHLQEDGAIWPRVLEATRQPRTMTSSR